MRKNDKFYYAEAVRAWQSGVTRSPEPFLSGLPNDREATRKVASNEAIELHRVGLFARTLLTTNLKTHPLLPHLWILRLISVLPCGGFTILSLSRPILCQMNRRQGTTGAGVGLMLTIFAPAKSR
jgi:hypothetical protein